jgi:hypothetical protein
MNPDVTALVEIFPVVDAQPGCKARLGSSRSAVAGKRALRRTLKEFMDITIQNDFYRVFSAYRQGIVNKGVLVDMTPMSGGRTSSPRLQLDFDRLASCACLGLSSPQERLASRGAELAARRGFLAARDGELELARASFGAAWQLWGELKESFCRTRLASIIESYEAYLEYRLSDRRQARRRLENALDSCLLLEIRYGLTLFELHRMQLGHNLARVDWRFGFHEEAFVLAGALVGYLQGRRQDLPFHRDWRADRMQSCPTYLRQVMVVQIAGEAISHLVSHPETASWETFLGEAAIDDDASGSRFFADPRLWRWLRARRARLAGDRRRYFETLEEILPAGPRGLGTLYYAILIDFAEFCAAEASIAARKVVGFLTRDAAKWKGFPVPLARRLAKISGNSEEVTATEMPFHRDTLTETDVRWSKRSPSGISSPDSGASSLRLAGGPPLRP